MACRGGGRGLEDKVWAGSQGPPLHTDMGSRNKLPSSGHAANALPVEPSC